MTNRNDANDANVRQHNPDNAATDPNAAAQQNQVKADHDALQEQARRVEASVPANGEAATDPDAAAAQDQVHADHDRMEAQTRRVEASVPADVRDTPIERANLGNQATEDNSQSIRNVDAARDNADAARDSARRVQDSAPEGLDTGRR